MSGWFKVYAGGGCVMLIIGGLGILTMILLSIFGEPPQQP